MNCANHPDASAVAYCRTCGKPLCTECKREAQGSIFCQEHVPVIAAEPSGFASTATNPTGQIPLSTPPVFPRQDGPSPGVAFLLGLIPGVGAIYNGQYAKGLVHAVVFGILVSIISSHDLHGLEPLFGIMIAVWYFYMALEAYHTAKKRRDGIAVEEFSSLIEVDRTPGRFPVGPIALIGLGAVLLLIQADIISFYRLVRLWPVGLILIGVYLLYVRVDTSGVRHE